MSFTSNLKTNLMGEVLIINVSYLLEDAVELMMQYVYFDKYAGVRNEWSWFLKGPDFLFFDGPEIQKEWISYFFIVIRNDSFPNINPLRTQIVYFGTLLWGKIFHTNTLWIFMKLQT